MSLYADAQHRRDREYAEQYRRWVAGLPAQERARLAEAGLLEPSIDAHGTGKGADVSEMPLADPSAPSPAAALGEEWDAALEMALESARRPVLAAEDSLVWDVVRRIVGDLLGESNARLALECFALVSGLGFEGDSMTAIARRHRVTRAAVSKRCVEICRRLGLKPARAMRPLTARPRYARAQYRHRHRHERFEPAR